MDRRAFNPIPSHSVAGPDRPFNSFGLKSLALATDLIVSRLEATVTPGENYLVVKTPSQPHYFWGNYLIFFRPPQEGDFERWCTIYKKEFSMDQPGFYTMTWDARFCDPDGVDPFISAGFTLEKDVTLVCSNPVKPVHFNPEIELRIIDREADWAALAAVHAPASRSLENPGMTEFMRRRIESFRRMHRQGLGHRFGAFLNGRLVGDLGIYHENALGRFNLVATHPEFRRQGVCRTLVYLASKYAFEKLNVEQLVIVAESDSTPSSAYQAAGFRFHEDQYSLMWYDRSRYGDVTVD